MDRFISDNNDLISFGNELITWPDPEYNVHTYVSGNGTLAATPVSGYNGDLVTLTPTPERYNVFTNFQINGATLTGSAFTIDNSDVYVTANFSSTAKYYTAFNLEIYGAVGTSNPGSPNVLLQGIKINDIDTFNFVSATEPPYVMTMSRNRNLVDGNSGTDWWVNMVRTDRPTETYNYRFTTTTPIFPTSFSIQMGYNIETYPNRRPTHVRLAGVSGANSETIFNTNNLGTALPAVNYKWVQIWERP